MNKTELVKTTKEIVSKELEGVTIKDTDVFVEATIKAIQDALLAGEKITINGLGTFDVIERKERMGKDPRTSEDLLIPASKTVKFKVSRNLRDKMNA